MEGKESKTVVCRFLRRGFSAVLRERFVSTSCEHQFSRESAEPCSGFQGLYFAVGARSLVRGSQRSPAPRGCSGRARGWVRVAARSRAAPRSPPRGGRAPGALPGAGVGRCGGVPPWTAQSPHHLGDFFPLFSVGGFRRARRKVRGLWVRLQLGVWGGGEAEECRRLAFLTSSVNVRVLGGPSSHGVEMTQY